VVAAAALALVLRKSRRVLPLRGWSVSLLMAASLC
jgi:hypothetical protein